MDHEQIRAHRASIEDSNRFWLPKAKALITWTQEPTCALAGDRSAQPGPWFPDGEFSTCYNLIDRHDPERTAIVYESPVTKTRAEISYGALRAKVECLAGVLRDYGVGRGDTVLIFMPMVPDALVGIYACTRIAAIHSIVFGGFAAAELAKRIEDCRPKVILTATCGVERSRVIRYLPLVTKGISLAGHNSVHRVLVLQRKECIEELKDELCRDWRAECDRIQHSGKQVKECALTKSSEMLYLLYTSGTTGKPKGVVRECGGHAVQLAFTMDFLFGLKAGDVMFTASDIGWVVGHAYIVYAPLLIGATTVLYEGKPIGTPDAGEFWRIISRNKVNAFFTAPTALRAIRREDPDAHMLKSSNITSLRGLFLAGERSEPSIVQFYADRLKEKNGAQCRVIDNYWSTEIGSPITAISMKDPHNILPIKPGSAGPPLPGMDVQIVDDDGNEVKFGTFGNIVIKLPLAPTAFRTLWNNAEGFKQSYFERFKGKWFDTGDCGIQDTDGYVHVMSRNDDIINVAAHRLSTGSIEQVVVDHPGVAEACVVGLPDEQKGHVPIAFITYSAQDIAPSFKTINEHVRDKIGGIASLAGIIVMTDTPIPRTRSGKTLRRVLRTLVENAAAGQPDKEVNIPPTIENTATVDHAREATKKWFSNRNKPKL